MAEVMEPELIKLIGAAFDRTVAEDAVDLDNISESIATALVRAVLDAGMIVIRDERDRGLDAADQAALAHLREPSPA